MSVDPTLQELVARALAEDVGPGDWTTLWTVPEARSAVGRIVAKQSGYLAGLDAAALVFRELDPDLEWRTDLEDGDAVAVGDEVATVAGSARSILTGERTALNLLQHLSGIASLTRRFVDAVADTDARILDTRKTTPGIRFLEKDAVVAGGGTNHRHGLFDMILIKDNHIAAAGGIARAIAAVDEANDYGLDVEVEVRDLEELEQALKAGVDRILLDNMSVEAMTAGVEKVKDVDDDIEVEASGNMTLDRVAGVAATGVDFISVGALTHSAPALDLSMLLELE